VTKQAMAELVHHLEAHDHVTRVPDPADPRAKLVRPTDRGREVLAIARQLVPELEDHVSSMVGADRMRALKADLEAIRQRVTGTPRSRG
jgi:DNA-binding MarR family transcriptional regulator